LARQTTLKTVSEHKCSGMARSSCSRYDTSYVTQGNVKNPIHVNEEKRRTEDQDSARRV